MAKFTIGGKVEAEGEANNISKLLKEITDKTGIEFQIRGNKGTYVEICIKVGEPRKIYIESGLGDDNRHA